MTRGLRMAFVPNVLTGRRSIDLRPDRALGRSRRLEGIEGNEPPDMFARPVGPRDD